MARKRYPPSDREPVEPERDEGSIPEEIPFNEVLTALLDENTPLQPRFVYRLSDLGRGDLAELERTWEQVPVWRRQALMEDVEELGESDYLLSFEGVSRLALQDGDPRVRELAVRALWEYESDDLIPFFFWLMENDSTADVRAAAASALGKYVYLGEIEELSEELLSEIEDRLLKVANGSDLSLVRRQCLEALGFSGNPLVGDLIEKSYASGNNDWVASALFAMGRSANERWIPQVMEKLTSDYPAVRLEAARAAGELEVAQAVDPLLELLDDEDDDVRAAAIWSLSQIGGEGVREALEESYEFSEDDEETELIEAALDNLDFTEEVGFFSTMLDIPDEDQDEALDEKGDEDDLDELFGEWDEEEDEDEEDDESPHRP
jgi:hypothetical protein